MPNPLRNAVKDAADPVTSWVRYRRWERSGRPLPAPHPVKREIIRSYARDYGTDTLVETGTYYADTVRGLRHDFRKIYSIELDERLYRMAVERCKHQSNAVLLHGDSSAQIKDVVAQLTSPALFWLDAHYSAGDTAKGQLETPIAAELDVVLSDAKSHVVLVDDMREFVNAGTDYPALETIEQIANQQQYVMTTALDVIRLVPR